MRQPGRLQKPRQGAGLSREPTDPVQHPLESETAGETCCVLCAESGVTFLCDPPDCVFHHDFFFHIIGFVSLLSTTV